MKKIIQLGILAIIAHVAISCSPEQSGLQDLYFRKNWMILDEGAPSFTIPVALVPEDVADVMLVWSSSNPEVATIDSEGLVTLVAAEGETLITASFGNFADTCRITVVPKEAPEEDDPVPPAEPVHVAGIKIDKTFLVIEEGQTETIKAAVSPEDADNQAVCYSSSDLAVAMVDSTGAITGVKAGQAVVTASTEEGGFPAYCLVTVYHTTVHVAEVNMDRHAAELDEGSSLTLNASVSPQNADDTTLVWSSLDGSIATVDGAGQIIALKPGKTTIYATSADGGLKDSCEVTVLHVAIRVTGIAMAEEDLLLTVGDTHTATASVEPVDADNLQIIWQSEDDSVASVDTSGRVTALSAGQTTIKAIASDGGFEDACRVTVVNPPVKLTSIATSPSTISLREGQELKIEVVFTPSDATDRSFAISSDDENVATAAADGTITARSAGEATIEITTTDGGHKAKCHVTVIPKHIPVTKISLDKSSVSLVEGGSARLSATVLPENADTPGVRFESSDSSVASVDQSGLVTAHKAGQAVITAISEDNGMKATATVDVKALVVPLEGIAIDKTSLTLHYPDQAQLKAILTPSNATAQDVEWSCGNPEIATVDNDGNVTATGVGKAVVTASCGGFAAACSVTVEHTVITSVEIDGKESVIEVESGDNFQLSATVMPENASDKSIVWSSSDTDVATVDANGLVSFKRFGQDKQVTISASSAITPEVSCSQEFKVKKGDPALTVNGNKEYYDFTTGELAGLISGTRVSSLVFGKVKINAADIQAIKDKAKYTLNSIDLSKASFAVDDTQFIGYQINDNILKVSIKSETEVPEYMFYEFTALSEVQLPECTTKIGVKAFYDSKLASMVLPPNTISIGDAAFGACPLSSLTLNDGLNTIGEYIFSGSTQVNTIEELILPDSVTSISSDSFFGLTKLKRIKLSAGINVTSNPLSGCTSLTTIEVPAENKKLKLIDSCLVSVSGSKTLVTYPAGLSAGKDDITVGNGTTRIASYACNYLQNTGCVTVAEGVEYIYNSMQFGSFTSIDLPSTLLGMNYNTFLSSPVKTIKLRSTTPPSVSGGSLIISAVEEILVPEASVESYKSSSYWSKFASKITGY